MDLIALKEGVLTLKEDEEFVWETEHSKKLLRYMMMEAMEEVRRDLIQEPGPKLVEANRNVKEARLVTKAAHEAAYNEMLEILSARLLGTLVQAGKVRPGGSVVSGDTP